MTWRLRHAALLFAFFCAALGVHESASALIIPPAPPLDRPIVDQTKTLSTAQIDSLSSQIVDGQNMKDYQLGILIIPKLEDEDLEGYSLKVAREWGIGKKDEDNGVLLLIAKDDRKMRIEVGRGLEGDLTDVETGRILRQVLTPNFKQNNYYEGIKLATESIQAQVEGKADPHTSSTSSQKSDFFENAIFFIIVAIFWLAPWVMWVISILARSKSWWAGGVIGGVAGGAVALLAGGAIVALIAWGVLILAGLLFDFFISKNYKQHIARGDEPSWWAGGTWSNGSSGGSWGGGSSGGGFGGGGFGGGGSSGSW